MSDDYLKDEDLLSILEDNALQDTESSKSEKSEVEKAMSEDSKPVDTAITVNDLQTIANQIDFSSGNPGSGNIETDLSNWFEGVDNIPSEGLNALVANASIKLDYGLTHTTLTSFRIMSKLRKFIEEDAFDMLFSETAILGLDPEDILDRVKTAFAMYKELGTMNQRTIQSMKDYRLKAGSETSDVDRLSMLLSTIPSDKLEKVLKEIAFSNGK